MKKKTLTKTICFKTTEQNYTYLKMFGNVNRKLNEFVNFNRKNFESYQGDFFPIDEEKESIANDMLSDFESKIEEMVKKPKDLILPDELVNVSDDGRLSASE